MANEEEKRKTLWSVLLLALSLLTLVCTLVLCCYGLYGLSMLNHDMKMEQLNTEKEIALINNNLTQEVTKEYKAFSCVVMIKQWNGLDYEDVYEYVDTCYEVNK